MIQQHLSYGYTEGMETPSGYNKGTCTTILIAALFTIAKLWK
jgi:hypothetical protein